MRLANKHTARTYPLRTKIVRAGGTFLHLSGDDRLPFNDVLMILHEQRDIRLDRVTNSIAEFEHDAVGVLNTNHGSCIINSDIHRTSVGIGKRDDGFDNGRCIFPLAFNQHTLANHGVTPFSYYSNTILIILIMISNMEYQINEANSLTFTLTYMVSHTETNCEG